MSSTACWISDARTPSASPDPRSGPRGIASIPPIPATTPRKLYQTWWIQVVVATPMGRLVAMAGRRRSDRALRAKLGSPGRPPVARCEDRRRFWTAIAAGQSSENAGVCVGCRRQWGHDGFGRQAACHQRRLVHRRRRHPGDICRLLNGRSLRSCGCRVWAYGRSHDVWNGRHRRCRVSYVAMPRRAAAAWSIGPPRRSGTRSGRHDGRSRRSWL